MAENKEKLTIIFNKFYKKVFERSLGFHWFVELCGEIALKKEE